MTTAPAITRLDANARLVTAALSSRFLPNHDTEETRAALDEMSPGARRAWMAGALGLLLGLALVAAQFGIWGLAAYFAAVVVLIR
jgi:hypothetical protein